MLGSLAKWLRIMGLDTTYYRAIDDRDLVKKAKQEQRILLTRDSGLCSSKMIGKHIFIHSNETMLQLKEVLLSCGITPVQIQAFKRCPLCNGILLSVNRRDIFFDIPEHVLQSASAFLKCSDCGKVYWEGSHKIRMDAEIESIVKTLESAKGSE